jgi:16S rRNA (adenine1518-N6/adenine1519-N6)-dimethyltransferase
MQTKNQIRQLLESSGLKPNKRLGQHFLIDLNLMKLLADSADIQKEDVVLEAGCGTGSFTAILAEKAGRIIAVELDNNLYKIAKEQVAAFDNIDLLNTDVLENKNTINNQVVNLLQQAHKLFSGRVILAANLPYNVASPLMMNLITGNIHADCMYVTVQKEVADRMKAQPGSSDYGVLSIILQACGEVVILRILKPSVFWPMPQVDSAMVKFFRNEIKCEKIKSIELFIQVVHLFMNHRRKTLQACIKLDDGQIADVNEWNDIFEKCLINPQFRPDQITPEQYAAISSYIKRNP